MYPPLIEHKSTELNYTTYVWHIEECPDPPLIEHKSTEPYYTMTVWSIVTLTHTQGRWTPPLIEPTATQPDYTKYISNIEECPWPPANQAQVHRALLHQDSITYWGTNTYLRQMDPPHPTYSYRAWLHHIPFTMHIYPGQSISFSCEKKAPHTPKGKLTYSNAQIDI